MTDNDRREMIEELVENSPYNTGKIRNPERIEPICEALEQRWKESPDMRLGQLVSVLTEQYDPFGVEDTYVMDELGIEFEGEFWADKEDINDG